MTLDESERARLASGLTDLMVHLADSYMADRGLGRDNANVVVSAVIGTAVAAIRRRGLGAGAAVALITCTAEQLANDWQGTVDGR